MAKKKTTPQVSEFSDPDEHPVNLDMLELTLKQNRFVEHYIQNGNKAKEAYIQAFGQTAKDPLVCGHNLLQDPRIKRKIEFKKWELQEMLNFKSEDHLRILIGKATASIDDFLPLLRDHTDPKNYANLGFKRYAIKSVKAGKYGPEVELYDGKAALDELNDLLGLRTKRDSSGVDAAKGRMASTMAALKRLGIG